MSFSQNKVFSYAQHDLLIRDLSLDSRNVRTGDLFLAVPGSHLDGRAYITNALERGAVAVVYELEGATVLPITDVPMIPIKGLAAQLSDIARQFYGDPSRQLNLVGVTGTNGKTSVTHLIAQALELLGQHCGIVGTLGAGFCGELQSGSHTTPNQIAVQATLMHLQKAGAETVAMEVSSHGLDQGRVAGLAFDVAVITNLSRDHLDYHGTMEAYAATKGRLFTWNDLKCRVVNLDDTFGRKLAIEYSNARLITYSLKDSSSYLYCCEAQFSDKGVLATLVTPQGKYYLCSTLIGRFNLSNMLASIGALLGLEYSLDEILHVLPKLKGPIGRMHCLGGGFRPLVVIDYAHTPDAIEKVLIALRPHAKGKLLCLFGCGGDRDRGKRPLMAKIVERLADSVLVTDDNPRSEDSGQIFDNIRVGFKDVCKVSFINDRSAAIAQLIASASVNDVVLLAGKGHETYQEINGKRYAFSDLVEADHALTTYEVAHA
ncbi:UDP-N-acetylmuramoyl-L-alanyl-D-glutamate--2,6-diaminopimelate ligase [Candidatus Pseudomonas adelgestsugas]|uniref:UDP-N-acetylmuramoyl-L-alanyl-D-glutamate--2,6-diaminopimelate ligase n=1 Tax=Candidatus Pseudomonas adelgestsugas TaxID=1302376 RepID=A0ABX5R983_9PSED|nr:UDP-N-acetylmuramoyl-L-alanyl-D-glutamate--2,6-diaminopimelate ligase [Candidatus Pseudomonas adelgestsugas]QAX81914.1 UDP-N-acetylmuramoyl-L-alanyl-D-glutamate--2,6-diaminopimelate ligase [Candidatus Pseudomonas adelgestsugas]